MNTYPMIKKLKYILLLSISVIFVQCGGDDPEKIAEKDREKILDYIAEENLEATEHESGLFYVIIREGNGTKYPTINSTVKVNYEGWYLDDKQRFDAQNAYYANLSSMIQGWRIGIPLLSNGAKAILLVPSGLGYGQYPPYGIRRNACLVFEVELIDILD